MPKAKRAKEEHIEIEAGSGNVFEDLGLPGAGERLAKAELARVIRKIVKEKNWTHTGSRTPRCCSSKSIGDEHHKVGIFLSAGEPHGVRLATSRSNHFRDDAAIARSRIAATLRILEQCSTELQKAIDKETRSPFTKAARTRLWRVVVEKLDGRARRRRERLGALPSRELDLFHLADGKSAEDDWKH